MAATCGYGDLTKDLITVDKCKKHPLHRRLDQEENQKTLL